jgi:hypothetical protein
VPEPLIQRLKTRAALYRRSLNREVIASLEAVAQAEPVDPDALRAPVPGRPQAHGPRAGPAQGGRPALIVVDTNLLVYLYAEGQRTAEAEAVLARDADWIAPLPWRSEFRQTLVGLVRRRVLGLDDAMRIVNGAEHRMSGREYAVLAAFPAAAVAPDAFAA